jgi:hypothetical protein
VTYSQSKISYSRHLEAVSLFDFDTEDETRIFEHEWKWGTVLMKELPAGVLICIRRTALDRSKLLLPAEISRGDQRIESLPDDIKRMRMVIPAVEALHIGPIPTAAFSAFILAAHDDRGGYLWHEVEASADALHVLSGIDADWNAAQVRRTLERRARGEYTLTETVEAAYARCESS